MRRLLTGYAIRFNRRHARSGHVFQNRYKSILCQEDIYLKELIRYIHLNPLRAGIVSDIGELDSYPYTGHSAIMGKYRRKWQSVDSALSLFDPWVLMARGAYRKYVASGIAQGKRQDLMGGGLIRSMGGWAAVKSFGKEGRSLKSDERILGDGDFVANVLAEADEAMERKYALAAHGVDLDMLILLVARMVSLPIEQIFGPGKSRKRVTARRLICHWGNAELGLSMTQLAANLGISLPTASVAAKKGAQIVSENQSSLTDLLNVNI